MIMTLHRELGKVLLISKRIKDRNPDCREIRQICSLNAHDLL